VGGIVTPDPYTPEADALVAAARTERENEQRLKTVETLRLLAACIAALADAVEEDDHILGPIASTGVANHLADLPRELRETFAECVSEEAARSARADRAYAQAFEASYEWWND
jgi:hypothetical protein